MRILAVTEAKGVGGAEYIVAGRVTMRVEEGGDALRKHERMVVAAMLADHVAFVKPASLQHQATA